MVNFRNLRCSKNGKLEPSSYLHLEISMDQEKILNLAEQDLRRSLIFRDAMQSSNRKLATRKLNVIGNMVGHCSVLTSDENLRRAREDCRLAACYEEISERQKLLKSLKDDKKKCSIIGEIPGAISKLKKVIVTSPSCSNLSYLLYYFQFLESWRIQTSVRNLSFYKR